MLYSKYFYRLGTNKYHLKKQLPLHSNISDWSRTGMSICSSHCHVAFHGSGRSISVNDPDTHFYPQNETYDTEGRRRLHVFSGEKKEISIPGLFRVISWVLQ